MTTLQSYEEGPPELPRPIADALENVIDVFQLKNADYAHDDAFSNFREVADNLGVDGIGAVEVAMTLLLVKVARLKALRLNKEDPANESVKDSFLDLACYATIAYALVLEGE